MSTVNQHLRGDDNTFSGSGDVQSSNRFDSHGGPQNIAQGTNPIGQQRRGRAGHLQAAGRWRTNAALLLRRSVTQVSDDARLTLGVAGCLAFAPFSSEPVTVILDGDEGRCRMALHELVNSCLLERKQEHWQISHALIHTLY